MGPQRVFRIAVMLVVFASTALVTAQAPPNAGEPETPMPYAPSLTSTTTA